MLIDLYTTVAALCCFVNVCNERVVILPNVIASGWNSVSVSQELVIAFRPPHHRCSLKLP